MRKNMWVRKVRISIMYVMIAAFLAECPAAAAKNFSAIYDSDRKGSITVTLDQIGTNRANVGIALYRIGEISNGYPAEWRVLSEYADLGIDLNNAAKAEEQRKAADCLWDYIKNQKTDPDYRGTTNQEGCFKAENLQLGIYLIGQTSGKDSYGIFQPFLVAIPYMEGGESWIYEIKTETKGEKTGTSVRPKKKNRTVSSARKTGSAVKTGDTTAAEYYMNAAAISLIAAGWILWMKQLKKKFE